ncbi:MAG: hypothetical protein HC828_13435 [Blastochloris sp.]|nr:hypothetical protein [Blastochloris sp.]
MTSREDLRIHLNALNTERDALGYDGDRHNAARAQLNTYRDYERRQKELEIARDSLHGVQELLGNAQRKIERLDQAVAEEREALETLDIEMDGLRLLVEEQHRRQAEVFLQRGNERQAYERLVNAQQELSTMDAQRAKKATLTERLHATREERALYEELKIAFSKNGIPAMIIDAALPELESGANQLLSRMTDGRMSLSLSTQREKITGGVAETLDIQIADELGTRSYELYSGGEAFRINFALRVALSQMLARRAGAQLRTLFIDEGFGTQDDDGRNKLIEAITAIQDDFDMILVITHIEELRDSFPVHIVINKTSDGSRVDVR